MPEGGDVGVHILLTLRISSLLAGKLCPAVDLGTEAKENGDIQGGEVFEVAHDVIAAAVGNDAGEVGQGFVRHVPGKLKQIIAALGHQMSKVGNVFIIEAGVQQICRLCAFDKFSATAEVGAACRLV